MGIPIINPADLELSFYAEIQNECFIFSFEKEREYEYSDTDLFEVSYNGTEDWYYPLEQ